jgi:AraC-like DNA-binding protein
MTLLHASVAKSKIPRMSKRTPALEVNRQRMKALLAELTPAQGLWPTALKGVRVRRTDHNIRRRPVLYEPSVFVVASGRKRGYVGGRELVYDPNNYVVLSVPLPFEVTTEVRRGEPLLGISVPVDLELVSELATRVRPRAPTEAQEMRGVIRPTSLELNMSDAVIRLLECLRVPLDAMVLGPGLVREITYRVLSGPQGDALLALVRRGSHLARIHATLQQIQREYAGALNVSRLAESANMSMSVFHRRFKRVTGVSPLRYLKAVRLHKARVLILSDGVGMSVAATKVGYESASQFSREFKRFFGYSPSAGQRPGTPFSTNSAAIS